MQESEPQHFRWTLIKQTLFFQLKLGLDAVRDIILSPVSITLAVIDLLLGHNATNSYYLRMMRYGRLSDRWINLFGEYNTSKRKDNVDVWLAKVETVIKEQRQNGALSESAKVKIEQYLAKVGKNSNDAGEPPA